LPKHYAQNEKAEWSYLLEIDDIGGEPKTYTFEASAQERTDLARRALLVSVESVQASITVQRVSGGLIHAMGIVRADLTQSCVVSLGPVPAHVEDEFEGWYGDKAKAVSFARARNDRDSKKAHTELEILEESVDPEPIINGKIDIGELATQYLILALDPYPRAEGVSSQYIVPEGAKDKEGADLRKNPFEALKDWKEKR
jgi:hypothetical protein